MDFHTLSRKELQTLCKKNKIPANLTNVAMADALAALDTVDGIEEILNWPESESPRTTGRTATRRNPVKQPEGSQPLTRTRRATARKATAETDQENEDVNLRPQTPSVPITRRRAQAASTRRKLDIEDEEKEKNEEAKRDDVQSTQKKKAASTAVRKGRSTRQSVRILDKNVAELKLTGPIKMDEETLEEGPKEKIDEGKEESGFNASDSKSPEEDDADVAEVDNAAKKVDDASMNDNLKGEKHEVVKDDGSSVKVGDEECNDENMAELDEDNGGCQEKHEKVENGLEKDYEIVKNKNSMEEADEEKGEYDENVLEGENKVVKSERSLEEAPENEVVENECTMGGENQVAKDESSMEERDEKEVVAEVLNEKEGDEKEIGKNEISMEEAHVNKIVETEIVVEMVDEQETVKNENFMEEVQTNEEAHEKCKGDSENVLEKETEDLMNENLEEVDEVDEKEAANYESSMEEVDESKTVNSDSLVEKGDENEVVEEDIFVEEVDENKTVNSDSSVEQADENEVVKDIFVEEVDENKTVNSDSSVELADEKKVVKDDTFVEEAHEKCEGVDENKTVNSDSSVELADENKVVKGDIFVEEAHEKCEGVDMVVNENFMEATDEKCNNKEDIGDEGSENVIQNETEKSDNLKEDCEDVNNYVEEADEKCNIYGLDIDYDGKPENVAELVLSEFHLEQKQDLVEQVVQENKMQCEDAASAEEANNLMSCSPAEISTTHEIENEILIDVEVIESEDFAIEAHHKTHLGSEVCESNESSTLYDVRITPEVEFAGGNLELPPPSPSTMATPKMDLLAHPSPFTKGLAGSPLAADRLPPFSCQKSSAKRDAPLKRSTSLLNNKENLDKSDKVEQNVDKENKSKENTVSLDDKSLRQLTKMLKEKLTLKNSKKEISQAGKAARPALQALPSDNIAVKETETN